MHLRSTTLIAFCDGEAGANRSRRTANHLSKCERCRHEMQRIQIEKDNLSVQAAAVKLDGKQGLAGVLSAIAAWQTGKTSAAASAVKNRLLGQMEMYFGAPGRSDGGAPRHPHRGLARKGQGDARRLSGAERGGGGNRRCPPRGGLRGA